jgi:hypothetical protein
LYANSHVMDSTAYSAIRGRHGGVFARPPPRVFANSEQEQAGVVVGENEGGARTLERLHSRVGTGVLVASCRALAEILAHQTLGGLPTADCARRSVHPP